jgi:hypothetical protein
LDNRDGYLEMSAMLTVLVADDCGFAVAVTRPLAQDNAGDELANVYSNALERMGEAPK